MTLPDATVTGTVFLKPKRAQPFFGRHPWVFAGAIDRVEGAPADGAIVDLRSSAGNFVARGAFNSQSKIRVRLYSWEEAETLDRAFFSRQLDQAIALRHEVLHLHTGPDAAYRVVFSESDRLSGLVVDRFGDWLTVQFTSLALAQRRQMIAELLQEKLRVRGVYLRTERGIGQLEGIEQHDGPILGETPPDEVIFTEHFGLRFAVNLTEGQKTGYYLDQRDNRATVSRLAVGRRVLDAFCYSGGFGIYAAKGGAQEVLCVDASEAALQLAQRNAVLNGLSQLTFQHADVFHHLGDLAAAGRKFDLIILDPPKFARNRAAIPKALQGYRKLHQQALRLLERGGLLVSCCCTGLITAETLEDLIAQVAMDAKRDVQILERRGPAPDHPVAISCRESGYLKCLITRVG
ncbi:MAG: class I SAM-dependent rRNA methyltransferase [Bacteroidales bacterium]|nr:class I SAM-dependent rRNA methyltransferase [Bacteroidales bacterium]